MYIFKEFRRISVSSFKLFFKLLRKYEIPCIMCSICVQIEDTCFFVFSYPKSLKERNTILNPFHTMFRYFT